MIPQIRYQPGDKLGGRYLVHQVLLGGMGEVYLCFDLVGGVAKAAKTFQDRFFHSNEVRDRFAKEALTWARLGKHPNIVEVYEIEQMDGKPFIIMEMIFGPEGYGRDLRSWLIRGRLDIQTSLFFAVQFCRGMQHVQSEIPELIHRDIKPENILISQNQIVKISDLGLAKVWDRAEGNDSLKPLSETNNQISYLTHTAGIGTPGYMSPEQISGAKLDIRSDIYSFGCVFYEMLSGTIPFRDSSLNGLYQKHLTNTPQRLSGLIDGFPVCLEDVISRCLSKRPTDRFNNFTELENAITQVHKEVIGHSIDYNPSNIKIEVGDLVNRAHSLFNLGYFENALKDIDKAIGLDPLSAEAWSNKGAILAALGRRKDALNAYDQAIELDPRHHNALLNKSASLIKLNRPKEAIPILDSIMSFSPFPHRVWHNKGMALHAIGRYIEAIECFDQALQIDPLLSQSWNSKGAVEMALINQLDSKTPSVEQFNGLERAMQYFLRSAEIDPSYKNARDNLVQAFNLALDTLPLTYRTEHWIWKTIRLNQESLEKVLKKILNVSKLELHPRYVSEIEHGPLRLIYSKADALCASILSVVEALVAEEGNLVHWFSSTDSQSRLGLFLVNEALHRIGLFNVPVQTAENLPKYEITDAEKLQIAKCMNGTGQYYRRLRDYDLALHCYDLGIYLYEITGDLKFCGHLHYNKGLVYQDRNLPEDKESAYESYSQSMATYLKLNLKDDVKAAQKRLRTLA